jgi:hypothetical protein
LSFNHVTASSHALTGAVKLDPPTGKLAALIAVGEYAWLITLGIPPVWGENAKLLISNMNIMKTTTPLYSLLTLGSLRLDFAIDPGTSFSKVKKGLSIAIMPRAAITANAGANRTNIRTIEVAK